jgi:hypothetical protein
MLARSGALPKPVEWAFERKGDGFRCLVSQSYRQRRARLATCAIRGAAHAPEGFNEERLGWVRYERERHGAVEAALRRRRAEANRSLDRVVHLREDDPRTLRRSLTRGSYHLLRLHFRRQPRAVGPRRTDWTHRTGSC